MVRATNYSSQYPEEEFETAKTRLVLTVRDSPDELISGTGIVNRSDRKWSAIESVSQTESALKHRDIVGITAVRRQGIGATKSCSLEYIRPEGKTCHGPVRSQADRETC